MYALAAPVRVIKARVTAFFLLFAEEKDPAVIESLEAMVAEIQSKLDYRSGADDSSSDHNNGRIQATGC